MELLVGGSFGPSCTRSLGSRHVSDLLRSYLTAGVFLVVAVALVASIMGLGSLIRPTRPQPEKYVNYESGVDPAGSMWGQTQVRYYLFALLFVLFDVEAVFIFPWATQVEVYGGFGAIEMGIFIILLALGLLYAWRKGVLKWV
jgi:NADH-quinone oxidoreductase subunit A